MRNIAFGGVVAERRFGSVFKSVTDPRDQGNKHHRDTSNTPKTFTTRGQKSTRIIRTHLFGKLETRRRCRSVLGGYCKSKHQNQSEKGRDFGAHLGTRIIKTTLFEKLETRRNCRSVLGGYQKAQIPNNSEKYKDFGAHLGTELRKNTNKCHSKQHPKNHSKKV